MSMTKCSSDRVAPAGEVPAGAVAVLPGAGAVATGGTAMPSADTAVTGDPHRDRLHRQLIEGNGNPLLTDPEKPADADNNLLDLTRMGVDDQLVDRADRISIRVVHVLPQNAARPRQIRSGGCGCGSGGPGTRFRARRHRGLRQRNR